MESREYWRCLEVYVQLCKVVFAEVLDTYQRTRARNNYFLLSSQIPRLPKLVDLLCILSDSQPTKYDERVGP